MATPELILVLMTPDACGVCLTMADEDARGFRVTNLLDASVLTLASSLPARDFASVTMEGTPDI